MRATAEPDFRWFDAAIRARIGCYDCQWEGRNAGDDRAQW